MKVYDSVLPQGWTLPEAEVEGLSALYTSRPGTFKHTVFDAYRRGEARCSSANSATAASGAGTLAEQGARIVGFRIASAVYYANQTFFGFDTSSLGASSTIVAATLLVFVDSYASTLTGSMQMQARQWDFGSAPTTGSSFVSAANLTAAPLIAAYLPVLTAVGTTGSYFAHDGYLQSRYCFVSQPSILTAINKTGDTRIVIHDERQILAMPAWQPTTNSYVDDLNSARLMVWYT